jgi:hypothetical protein
MQVLSGVMIYSQVENMEGELFIRICLKKKIQLAVFRSSTILANNILPINKGVMVFYSLEVNFELFSL